MTTDCGAVERKITHALGDLHREQDARQEMRGRRRGPKPRVVDPRVKQFEAENRKLQRKLARAETIITLPKQIAEILGIPLKPLDIDETD